MSYNNIPKELQERDKWIITDKDKKPLHPTGFHGASGLEPEHWISYQKALELLGSRSEVLGIAYVFTEADPFTGIYLNKCLLNEKISKRAAEIYHDFDSYTEHSQSPNGLNIIIKGRLSSDTGYQVTAPGEQRAWLEVHDRKQYFVMTGNLYKEPKKVEDRLDHLQRFETELNNKPIAKPDSSEIYLFKHTMKAVLPQWHYTEKSTGRITYELVGDCPFKKKHTSRTKKEDFKAYITNTSSLYSRCNHTGCLAEIKKLNLELNKRWQSLREAGLTSNLFCDIKNTAHYLEQSAPQQGFLVDGFLPAGGVGLLTAPAGTGKSFWLLSLACAVASQQPFYGNQTKKRRVLVVFGEEHPDRIHRRLEAQIKQYPKPNGRELIGQNLDLLSTYSRNARFQEETGSGLKPTPVYEELLNADYDLIILDPLTRFHNGHLEDTVSATRFIELLEAMTLRNNRTILISHHSGINAPASPHHHSEHPCGHAMIDAIPWVCQLSTLNETSALNAIEDGYQQIEGDNPQMWIKQSIIKANELKPGINDWYFRRGQFGILEKREPFTSST